MQLRGGGGGGGGGGDGDGDGDGSGGGDEDSGGGGGGGAADGVFDAIAVVAKGGGGVWLMRLGKLIGNMAYSSKLIGFVCQDMLMLQSFALLGNFLTGAIHKPTFTTGRPPPAARRLPPAAQCTTHSPSAPPPSLRLTADFLAQWCTTFCK